MTPHVVSPKVYVAVFLALLAGTLLTVEVARHEFGALNTVIALAIAVTKATLVVLFFMHVRYSGRLTWLVVSAAFVWLAILIVGTMSDYYSPGFQPAPVPNLSRQ